ncbi:MAG: hypothetical protein K2K60_04995 [Clostridia bacterium]|nr:hypothetical protein [Clostridia bacterium]
MRTDKINYACDDCGETATFSSKDKARKKGGWAVARDNKYCYCPECAPAHRLGGANGKRKNARPRPWLPKGCVQLSIDVK